MSKENWTPADEANYQQLAERRERVTSANRAKVERIFTDFRADYDDVVDYAILRAEAIRDALAPYDSGVREEPWIDWMGGKCPVAPGTLVEVQHRDGDTYKCQAGRSHASSWTHQNVAADIVAYRVVQA